MDESNDIRLVDEFHKEVSTLIRKSGNFKNAIIRIRGLNKDESQIQDIAIYELIINSTLEVYAITDTQLYEDNGKFVATEPRQTVFVLLKKYLNYTQENIATQFNKTRESINWAMMGFNKQIGDGKFYGEFIRKHKEVEGRIEAYLGKNKKSDESKKEISKKVGEKPAVKKSEKKK